MNRRTVVRQIYPTFLAIAFVAMAIVTVYASTLSRRFFQQVRHQDLMERALLLRSILPAEELRRQPGALGDLLESAGRESGTRITLVLANGAVAADSDEPPEHLYNQAAYPEIREALRGVPGVDVRRDGRVGRTLMHVAVPVFHEGAVVAALRVATFTEGARAILVHITGRIVLVGLLVLVGVVFVSLYIARRISRPLLVVREAALHYAREDFDYQFSVDTPEEIRALAETLNTMAGQLKTRIATIMRQRNELGAMLSSMLEAVIVLDTRLLIKTMNPAAVTLMHKSLDEAIGRSILEVVRNSELHDFSQRVLSNGETLEESVVLYDTTPCYLQAHGTVIRSERGDVEGVLLVMNDITRLKQLENMRKDFVANVSHELKTPITSIKGFVETLQDGALEDTDRARHFLAIINRHADRLNAIIDDLLILSKIEDNPSRQISFNRNPLAEVVDSALQVCEHQAHRRDIRLVSSCPPEFHAEINPILMEQALVNLVDNAIKYSNPGSTVEVRLLAKESYYVLSIVDSGCGIPERDLPRIFERFYRVDKARSRSLGGTGLGLAIVKHIAIIHGGEVTVDSDEGVGSVFSLILPVEQQVAAAATAAPTPS